MPRTLLAGNVAWAAALARTRPLRPRSGAAPQVFWIGCSDWPDPPAEILGLEPGAVFTHLNLANLASPHDASFLASLQFAVERLKTPQVVVCGHHHCSAVETAITGNGGEFVDCWLETPKRLASGHGPSSGPPAPGQVAAVAELNVLAQVRGLVVNPIVRRAWAQHQPLTVHGWMHSSADGLIRELDACVSNPREADAFVALEGARAAHG